MPTERFFNLPAEKRARIIAAAQDELSRVPFAQVSINQIIREAGIPRGSFYQYFEDKNDLLNFFLESFGLQMRQNIKDWLREYGGDVFPVFREILAFTIRFGTQEDHFRVCKNVFAHLRTDGGDMPDVVRLNIGALMEEFGPYVRLDELKLPARRDLADFIEALVVLMRRAIVRAFSGEGQADAAMESFENQMKMLKHGIMKEEDGE